MLFTTQCYACFILSGLFAVSSGRPLSSSRSRSRSSSAHSRASLSSLSSSGESEHLYRGIASDISSASSPAASPVNAVSTKQKTCESAVCVMWPQIRYSK